MDCIEYIHDALLRNTIILSLLHNLGKDLIPS